MRLPLVDESLTGKRLTNEFDSLDMCNILRNSTNGMRILKKKVEMVIIKVYVVEDKGLTTLLVQSEPEQLLENIFTKITHKRGLSGR